MALRQTCTVQVRARRIRYRRALQIAQNEEYLVGEDLSDIRRYGGDSAYVDSEYRVKRSMDQIKEKLGNEFEELTDTMELATPEQFSRSKRQTIDGVRINTLPQVKKGCSTARHTYLKSEFKKVIDSESMHFYLLSY